MTPRAFGWMGQAIPFRDGETVATALEAAGIYTLGADALGQETRYFCGIGVCQCCLVRIDGIAREACITPARSDMTVEAMEVRGD
jgi:aerobic-type carbon monoxide dehydrogenase small subunit (CoxS/CutS family)